MGEFVDAIGKAAMYELLAEECTELAKASLKMARIIRKENPTPVTRKEAEKSIIEEYADVKLCAVELGIRLDYRIILRKADRWRHRLRKQRLEAGNELPDVRKKNTESIKHRSRIRTSMLSKTVRGTFGKKRSQSANIKKAAGDGCRR